MTDPYGGLIAAESGRKFYEGAGIFESVSGTVEGIANLDPGGTIGNGAATLMSGLGAIVDPLQTLFAAGVGWAMEHVAVLREPLDRLMGDPKSIEGHAATWKNMEKRIYEATDAFVADVNRTTAAWAAESADAYRRRARGHADAVQAMGKVADGMGRVTTLLGAVVGVARNTIRDIVAQVVGAILSKALQVATGLLMPKALAEIALLVANTSTKILGVLKQLFLKIKEIGRFVQRMQEWIMVISKSNNDVLRLVAHRAEATELVRQGWTGPVKAYRVLGEGDVRVYGPMRQVLVNTGRSAAETNSSQNTGQSADSSRDDNPEPAPIDIPL
ncbi:hypothetical protein FHR83_004184 [Actinoplanes campanulatus]|uniref:Uncharacterized protein n=1 Tax=Actinoplanes campanulatus TaxID=113559 RepID=A0A7W5AIF0_9ACTN|nr:hypothetical protein [Actinoplanes campanulatus]MBB3096514.1 hypothetical protein [Actinoplanes campanulatus]GGN17727.1 hypothetical protein GCM10010109_30550 [Actinoplanes campanulatus]GID38581.1 hypothetical protein Aca09nite_50870 [Actinoplanes campanulatus]